MNDQFIKIDNKLSLKNKLNNFYINLKRLDINTIIFSKNKYNELKKSIDEIQVRNIKDYKTFEFIAKFEKQSDIGYKLLEAYVIYETLKIFSKFKITSEYEKRTRRIYPIFRINFAAKLYYLYLIYKFDLNKIHR